MVITITLFFFFINLLGTLPYAARIVGVRTKMLAVSFTLFNIIALITRTANGFQTPYLAKYIEVNLLSVAGWSPLPFFRWMLLVSTLGCIVGSFCIPTTQRLFTKAVLNYYEKRSLKKLVLKSLGLQGIKSFKQSVALPAANNFKSLFQFNDLPIKLFIYHAIATAFVTVGILAALYAGYLYPQFRTTAISFSFIINGLAVIIMFIFIDPPLSVITDDSVHGKVSESFFRRCITWFIIARIAGTLLAQMFLLPMARLTAFMALNL